jgi:hypothetical protein
MLYIQQNMIDLFCNLMNGKLGWRLLRNRGRSRNFVAKHLMASLKRRLKLFLSGEWQPKAVESMKTTPYLLSMTSWRPRIPDLPLALLTLLEQRLRPTEIIVWISHSDFPLLNSQIIERFLEFNVKFESCDDLKPHKKWLPLLESGYQSPFIICDDDMLYPPAWLENLMAEDRSDAYVGVRCHEMVFGRNKSLCSYEAWPKDIAWRSQPSHDVFITGCGGAIIYPERIALGFRDRKQILEICPMNDDIWLKAAHLDSGIPCYKTKFSFPCLEIPGSEASGLLLTNVDQSRNDQQMIIVKKYLK